MRRCHHFQRLENQDGSRWGCGGKKTQHAKPDKLRGGHSACPTKSKTKSNHIGCLKLPNSGSRWIVTTYSCDFLDKGQSLPLSEPVVEFLHLWNIRVICFFRPLSMRPLTPDCHLIPCILPLCAINVTNYPVPTNVREVCVSLFYFLSTLGGDTRG